MQPVPTVYSRKPIYNPPWDKTQQHIIYPDESFHKNEKPIPMSDPPPEILPQDFQHPKKAQKRETYEKEG